MFLQLDVQEYGQNIDCNFLGEIMLFLGHPDVWWSYSGCRVVGLNFNPQNPWEESVTYVNRVLAFMFATDESFEKLMALPKATRNK